MADAIFTTADVIEVWLGNRRVYRGKLTFTTSHAGIVNAVPLLGGTLQFRYPTKVSKAYGTLPPGGDTESPTVPTNAVVSTIGAASATASWDASTDNVGVTAYQPYVDGLPNGAPIDALSTTLTGLTPGAHTFQVQAFDAAGNGSALSAAVAFTLDSNTPPSVEDIPLQLLTIGRSYLLNLGGLVADVDGDPLTIAQVSGTLPAGITFSAAAKTVSGTPSTVESPTAGFTVSDGVNAAVPFSVAFEVLNADTTAPAVVTDLAGVVTGSTVDLSWTHTEDVDVADARTSGRKQYNVRLNGAFYVSTTENVYQVTNLSDGAHSFTVRVEDIAGNKSGDGNTVAVTIGTPVTSPSVPINLATLSISGGIRVSWAANPAGSAPTSYLLQISNDGVSGWSTAYSGSALTHDETSLAVGTVRYFRVSASNTSGSSAYTAVVQGTAGSTASSMVWNPGNYIVTQISPSAAQLTAAMDRVIANSYLIGVVVRLKWPTLETAMNTFNWAITDDVATRMRNAGKFFFFQLDTVEFGADKVASDVAPAYMLNATYDGGAAATPDNRALVKLWNANCMSRKIAVQSAIISRYQTNPYFEGIVGCETAVGANADTVGYTATSGYTQYVRLFEELRAAHPNHAMICYYNDFPGSSTAQKQGLVTNMRANKWTCGGPDSRWESGGTMGRKYAIGVTGTIDYRGTMAMQTCDQQSGLTSATYDGTTYGPWTITKHMDWIKNQFYGNYAFWTNLSTTNLFAPIMSHLSSNPSASFRSTKPSGY